MTEKLYLSKYVTAFCNSALCFQSYRGLRLNSAALKRQRKKKKKSCIFIQATMDASLTTTTRALFTSAHPTLYVMVQTSVRTERTVG